LYRARQKSRKIATICHHLVQRFFIAIRPLGLSFQPGGLGVGSSNLPAPTNKINDLRLAWCPASPLWAPRQGTEELAFPTVVHNCPPCRPSGLSSASRAALCSGHRTVSRSRKWGLISMKLRDGRRRPVDQQVIPIRRLVALVDRGAPGPRAVAAHGLKQQADAAVERTVAAFMKGLKR
jgi:hypothetical protein